VAGSQAQSKERRPSQYAQEAFAEWGKAARYAGRAVSPALRQAAKSVAGRAGQSGDRPPLGERLNPAKTEKGGRLGDVADAALSKLGGPAGTVASKFSAGSRIVERVRGGTRSNGSGDATGDAEGAASGADGFDGHVPIPIQESIEVAVPVQIAYSLFTDFESYPQFLDRVSAAKRPRKSRATFVATVRGRERELVVEIVEERPNRRLDWRCDGEIAHSGVVSFHELAPRLTHIELTVELGSDGVIGRLMRSAGLTQRAIRADLHRFKAYAELFEPADVSDVDEAAQAEDELEGEELEDEGDVEDEVEDEGDFDVEDEEELVDEEEGDLEDEDEDDLELEDEEELADEEEGDFEDEEELEGEDVEDEGDEDFEDEEGFEDEEDFEEDEELEPARAGR